MTEPQRRMRLGAFLAVPGHHVASWRHPDAHPGGGMDLESPTHTEAEEKYAQMQNLVDPIVGLGLLTGLLGDVDISDLPLDGPLPELPETQGSTSRQRLVVDKARREGLTIRDLYLSMAGSRGHRFVLGTPTSVADELEEWFAGEGADGFNVMPPILPEGLTTFVDLVVPELQRRGVFRTSYEGTTLRENLGVSRPPWATHRRVALSPGTR